MVKAMKPLPSKTDILVVGAGPCGLVAALTLAKAGVPVEIVDRARRPSEASFACGIHSATMDCLRALGLGAGAYEESLPVTGVGYYDQGLRTASVSLPFGSAPEGGGLWALPQDRLELRLEEELTRHGVRIHWGHRLDTLHQEEHAVISAVEEIGLNSVGYPCARTEDAVVRVREIRSSFLLAADGAHSHVRQSLGIGLETAGPAHVYEMLEIGAAGESPKEARVTFNPGSIDGYWPLPSSGSRWCLETGADPGIGASRRSAPGGTASVGASGGVPDLEARIRLRAPWYEGGIREVSWAAEVTFQPQVAVAFGTDHVWLAGDAAHQALPLGMQSMNIGILEASDLARRLVDVLANRSKRDVLTDYNSERRAEWRSLLGLGTMIRAGAKASSWVKAHRQQLMMTLPASGRDLARAADQLGLRFA